MSTDESPDYLGSSVVHEGGSSRRRRTESRRGAGGAAATAHPAATRAALDVLSRGGNATDAAIAAHLVIAVVLPQAAGLGGDLLALIAGPGSAPRAYTGVGRTAGRNADDPGNVGSTVTVPGMIRAAERMHRESGRLPWSQLFEGAIALADEGFPIDMVLHSAVAAQRARMHRNAPTHPLLHLDEGDLWQQPELASLLRRVAHEGSQAFYRGGSRAIVSAIRDAGGRMSGADLDSHDTLVGEPVVVDWNGTALWVQPPPSQGILLAMAGAWVADNRAIVSSALVDHLLIEATEAAFAWRDDCARGVELLDVPLVVDIERASHRGGPRAYLHTAGVATADADGMVVSSLSSVFDDFGSCLFVPELGIVLNNRGAAFTSGLNSPGAAKYPVHTLAPAMLIDGVGRPTALATPGADGQVQTLLSVLTRHLQLGVSLADAIAMPRWRSQEGEILVEESFPRDDQLAARGHVLSVRPDGSDLFGAVVCAGINDGPFAIADWRRQTTAGAR